MHEQLAFKSTSKVYAHVYAWEFTFESIPKVYAQEINLQKYFQSICPRNLTFKVTSKYMHEQNWA